MHKDISVSDLIHCSIQAILNSTVFNFKKYFIYLFLERGEGREKKSEGNISVWFPLTHTPYRGPGPQPRHVP